MAVITLFWIVVFAIVTGAIAKGKGRGPIKRAIFGAACFILALPCVLLASNKRHRYHYSDEPISKRASVGPHCHSQLALT